MGASKSNILYVTFKYGENFSPFLKICRLPKSLNVFGIGGSSWIMSAIGATDYHISYPEDGGVHYTIRKDRFYSVHVYSGATTITCYTTSNEPADMPDFNKIAIETLHTKGMVMAGPPLNEFKSDDFYSFPTSAFVMSLESSAMSFQKAPLSPRYGNPIDLTGTDKQLVNVHVALLGSAKKLKETRFIDPAATMTEEFTMGTSPIVRVTVTARPNE